MKKHCKAGSFFPLLRQWLIGEQQRNSPAICWSPSAACVTSFDCGWVAFSPSHPSITILSELLHAQPKMAAAFPLLFPGEDGVVVDLWPLYLQQIDIHSWITLSTDLRFFWNHYFLLWWSEETKTPLQLKQWDPLGSKISLTPPSCNLLVEY